MNRQTANDKRWQNGTGRLLECCFFCRSIWALIRSVAMAALVLFLACAKQGSPSGGPPDTTPPRVIWTSPSSDSVEVDLDIVIQIGFNESMDRRSVERAVFISPRPRVDPSFSWRGSVLEIQIPDSLRSDRTYLVTIGSESSDQWRNRMTRSFSFGFATGKELNQGTIEGSVRADSAREQKFVWVYDLQAQVDPNPSLDFPTYVTQPDEGGEFQIPRLGPGNYRVFAFLDRDRNRTYSPGADPLAVPPSDIPITDEVQKVMLGELRLVLQDTSAPQFISARTPDRTHISLRFSERIRLEEKVFLMSDTGPLNVLVAYENPTDSSRIELVTGAQQEGEEYEIKLPDLVDLAGNRTASGLAGRVRGDGSPDRRKPTVVGVFPPLESVLASPTDTLVIRFSEAMTETVPENFWVGSDSTDSPVGNFEWVAPNRLSFSMESAFLTRTNVNLIGRAESLSDREGNILEAGPVLRYSVVSPENLGEVSGRIVAKDAPVIIQITGIAPSDREFSTTISSGDTLFSVIGLIPGSYIVTGFLDRNKDELWTPGIPWPFLPSEPLLDRGDTLEVRARWEAVSEHVFEAYPWREIADELIP